jgi:hypothetical protein
MQELISLSFINYDKQTKKYKKYYNNEITLNYCDDKPIFELNNDKKILMKGDFNFIGRFFKNTNIFKWGWDFLYINHNKQFMKNNTYYIKKIINYIFNLNINADNIEELIFYYDIKNMFLHNNYKIEFPIQLEQILAITLLITKSDLIYKVDNVEKNYTDYYILRNVKTL